jgi:hypothetical protein
MSHWRFGFVVLIVGVASGLTAVVTAQFISGHVASGSVNTATSTSDLLYICQPSGILVSPLCPVDAGGADEPIFVGSEDLLPGSVRWQKIRLTNTGATEAWDLLAMSSTWTKVFDPGGTCSIVPEGVYSAPGGVTTLQSTSQPGVTVLGVPGNYATEPLDHVRYDPFNDDHGPGPSASQSMYVALGNGQQEVVHVAPGGFEDLLLGIRLPVSTPASCVNVIWQLDTTWSVQIHTP